MGPLTRISYEATDRADMRRDIANAAHVHVPFEMWWRVRDIAAGLPKGSMWEGRLPSPTTVLEVEGKFALLATQTGGDVAVSYLAGRSEEGATGAKNLVMTVYTPKTHHIRFGKNVPRDEGVLSSAQTAAVNMTSVLDTLFGLMAEPRFIHRQPVSRTRRAMAAKKMGVPALRHTWVKVGWTIGKAVRQKGNIAAAAPQKAFHMVRAHWRLYDRQTPKAERRDGHPGWWVWIEAHYSGNPALGEIKHHYCPKIDDPGVSSHVVHRVVAAQIANGLPGA